MIVHLLTLGPAYVTEDQTQMMWAPQPVANWSCQQSTCTHWVRAFL